MHRCCQFWIYFQIFRHDHMPKYLKLPDSWRSKNYAFEFVECIDSVVKETCMQEIRESELLTLIVDESTDISVAKTLIIDIKYRVCSVCMKCMYVCLSTCYSAPSIFYSEALPTTARTMNRIF